MKILVKTLARNLAKPAVAAVLFSALTFGVSPAYAVNKDLVQLQTQVQELEDAIARLQKSNDESMGVLKSLVQQSTDTVNKMSVSVDALQRQSQAQQEATGGKVDAVAGQVQSLNDSLDELKARLAKLEKITTAIQTQQQSMNASLPAPSVGSPAPPEDAAPATALPPAPTTSEAPVAPVAKGRRGKPSPAIAESSAPADIPANVPSNVPAEPNARPVDELYQTALGDYMAAKYALALSEFGDVIKAYPDNPLAGNSFYYQAEIDYRNGRYTAAVKAYDKVIEQFPGNGKIPVSHLHKGQALIAMKQPDAGIREYRALIQRFPASQEASIARSRLNGMGVPIVPRTQD